MIAESVQIVRRRIEAACQRASRNANEITLIAVTKTFGSECVREVVQAGVHDVGENYVQELRQKRDELRSESIRWHFIGHLQTNKIKYIADWVHLIHAVDSLNLGRHLSEWARRAGRTLDFLVEVNTTGEPSKYGVGPDAVEQLVRHLSELPAVRLQGLMTMGPFEPDPEHSRPAFRQLRTLRDSLVQQGFLLPHLSMGMTNDFEVAVEEGATMVRVGTAIFGSRTRKQ
jgi:pyridoxal phosphate enzyme (YggS family)